eukprot:1193721-Prorocentrum_minimum.AAC.1
MEDTAWSELAWLPVITETVETEEEVEQLEIEIAEEKTAAVRSLVEAMHRRTSIRRASFEADENEAESIRQRLAEMIAEEPAEPSTGAKDAAQEVKAEAAAPAEPSTAGGDAVQEVKAESAAPAEPSTAAEDATQEVKAEAAAPAELSTAAGDAAQE